MHDLSDGGLAVALAEMAMAGGIGATIDAMPDGLRAMPSCSARTRPATCWLRRADEARRRLLYEASALGVPAATLGVTGGDSLMLPGEAGHIGGVTDAPRTKTGCRLHGRRATEDRLDPWPMDARDIESMIKAALPDAVVEITDLAGDGDHYAATVTSSAFKGKSRVQQHQIVYAALQGRMGGVLHALALTTATPDN